MAHTYSNLYDLPTTGLRFFTVYGSWGRPDMALFKFTKAIHSVEKALHGLGCRTYVLDGDNVRHSQSSNLTFSDDGLNENIRRIVEAAKLMMEGWRYYFECIHQSINNKLYLYCNLYNKPNLLNNWFVVN